MPLYHTNELIMNLPEQFIDKTHHVFSLTDEGPSEFNLVISRHPVEENESLWGYGSRLVAELERTLPQFRLLFDTTMTVAQHPALKLIYRWVQQGQTLHQVQVSFLHDPAPGRRQVIQITATALNNLSHEWQQTFNKLLASMELRQDPPSSRTTLQ